MTEQEVKNRDRNAACYDYYKPLKGEVYRGLKGKRRHLCEKCGKYSLIAPEYYWRGRGCQNCSSKRGQGQQFDGGKVAARDKAAACYSAYPPDEDQKYIGQYKKRNHTCRVCGHRGQLTAKSFWGGTGCPVCGVEKAASSKVRNAARYVNERDKAAKCFDTYPPIGEYKGVAVYRQHQCAVCGHIGKIKPDNFWHNGRGCPRCGVKLGSGNKRSNIKKIAPERDKKSIHYKSYPPVTEYTGAFEHRLHRCAVCGHEGKMTPNNFWRGRGCPVCAESGFNKSVPAILYYLRVERPGESPLYKIGITNRTVHERFNSKDLGLVSTVKEWRYELGSEAYEEEQRLIKINKRHRYTGDVILASGNIELFTRDVLGLDKGQ